MEMQTLVLNKFENFGLFWIFSVETGSAVPQSFCICFSCNVYNYDSNWVTQMQNLIGRCFGA